LDGDGFLFFFNIEYLICCFVLRGRRIEGLASAKPCPLVFLFIFSFIFTNIEYLFYSLSCADGGSFFNIEYLFYSFVLRGRRIEGLAGAKPLYELPRFS